MQPVPRPPLQAEPWPHPALPAAPSSTGLVLPPASAAGAVRAGSRLDQLKALPRRPGQASFMYRDTRFNNDAVKVLPGEFFVHHEDILIVTTLGSCIAVCLWDRERHVGGMNHFMLPAGDGQVDGGRYGAFAMDLLIGELIKRGATRATLEAKVFGGGAVLAGMSSLNIGERNTRFALDYLRTERIAVVSKDVLDIYPRKVCFLPASGKALVKKLPAAHNESWLALESAALAEAPGRAGGGSAAAAGGSVDLF